MKGSSGDRMAYTKRLFVLALIFSTILMLNGQAYGDTEPNGAASEQIKDSDPCVSLTGPTIFLICDKEKPKQNPVSRFMYFVPLLSPTSVDIITSPDNEQQSEIISSRIFSDSNSFHVCCEFKIYGRGFYKNIFDSTEMIKRNTENLEQGKPLKDILDYIKFEGDGFGSIDITGKIDGQAAIVTEVAVHFNGRGQGSPVTIGLYSIEPVNGEYKYENRYDRIVARVNTLIFKRSEDIPRMGIKIASINKEDQPARILGDIKGWIANFFIKPLEVDKQGNDAMLDLGLALFKKAATFTFPKSHNLKEDAKDNKISAGS